MATFAVTTRNDSATVDFQEFTTLDKAKAFGAEKLKALGSRVNNVTVYQPDYAPSIHASLTRGRVRWQVSKF